MKYKKILFEKDWEVNRLAIVKAGGTAFESNLVFNEIAIDLLLSDRCPIKKSCVEYVVGSGVSIFCEHFSGFLRTTASTCSLAGFFCSRSKTYHELSRLKPVKCPISRNNCRGCKHLSRVITDPITSKSNCHVLCEASKE